MATRKDLVEAHSFSRRRLVTAFVSGAPGGREVELPRPGRTLAAGVAVAVLLVAGAAVLGIVRSPSTVDWTREGLVSDRDTGVDYLVLRTATAGASGSEEETEVRPLANITSALLVLGPGARPTEVAGDEIADRPRGLPIGIAGAPEAPPRASSLVPTGWTACTGGGGPDEPSGVRLRVADEPAVTPTPDLAFLVRTVSGGLHLVAQTSDGGLRGNERAHAYPVPDTGRTDNVLNAVAGTDEARAVTVPDAWVALFPEGGALERRSFGIDGAELDAPWPPRDRLAEDDARTGAEIGDLLEVEGRSYLLTAGGVRALSGFATALYEQLDFPAGDDLATYEVARLLEVDVSTDALPGTWWPESIGDTGGPPQHLCALLDTPGGQPGVLLATTGAGSEASAEQVPLDAVDRAVEAGHGAFVSSGDWSGDDVTGPVLVDDTGRAHPVGTGEEAERLGYDGVEDVVVPAPWLALLEPGVRLTVEAAGCPPDPGGGTACP